MKMAARSEEKFKTLQFVVGIKSQVLRILNLEVYNRTCSLRDLSISEFRSLQTASQRARISKMLQQQKGQLTHNIGLGDFFIFYLFW